MAVHNHASYGIVDTSDGSFAYEVHQVQVNADQLTADVATSGMPYGDWWLGLRRA